MQAKSAVATTERDGVWVVLIELRHHGVTSHCHAPCRTEAPYEEEKKAEQDEEGALTLSAKDQLTLSDYELPYIDEDDTEEEDG